MLPNQRHLFAVPREVAYFDCAKMSPLLRAAAEAGAAGLRRKLAPWEIGAADFFDEVERVRGSAGRLLGTAPDNVAFVPAVSYGLAVAARNLRVARGQRVVVLAGDFPSVALAAMRLAGEAGAELVTVERPAAGGWTPALLDAITDGTAVVFSPHVHWTDGGIVDLAAVGARCRAAGAALVVDATQSLGALPLDLASVDPDFLVAASYKWLFGPYALGLLHAAPRHHGGEPLEQGWSAREGARDFRRLIPYQEGWEPGARRFDMGERANFALLPALAVALDQLAAWTPAGIAETLGEVTARLAARLGEQGIRAAPAAERAPHFLSVTRDGGWPEELGERLAAAQVHVSLRGERMRITPHLYNTQEDEERLVAALAG